MATVGKRKKSAACKRKRGGPTRTATVGKRQYKSGAQKRRERREREEAISAAGREAKPATDNGAGAFATLGPAPMDDPDTSLRWVRMIQLRALELAVADPDLPLATKLRTVKDLAFTAGATANRSALETRIAQLEEALGLVKGHQNAVSMRPTTGLPRPSTSRGMRRKPRAVPPPPVVDSDDDGNNNEE
jgi:hypothetical protein